MTLSFFTSHIQSGEHLTFQEAIDAAKIMFQDDTPLLDIEQFLVALSQKGETASEIAAVASVMRSHAVQIEAPEGLYIDNCGTGGDGLQSFNISTTAAFVLAGAGLPVAKHGNRKISSLTGSSDVLEELGIGLLSSPEQTSELLTKYGIAFLHAPNLHPRLGRIGEVRRKIGKPTIFNLVGPLTNPIPLRTQFVGISRPQLTTDYAHVLDILDRKRAVVVSGSAGMDEASLAGENTVVLLDNGDIIPFKLRAEDVGLTASPLEAIQGGNPAENAQILRDVLQGQPGPYLDTVLLNAGIALFAYGTVKTMKEGIEVARDSIMSGRAYAKLQALVDYSKEAQFA